jgi:hypothetical protein
MYPTVHDKQVAGSGDASVGRNPLVVTPGHNDGVHKEPTELTEATEATEATEQRRQMRPTQTQDDAVPAVPEIRTLRSSVVYADDWTRLQKDEIERLDGSRGTYAFID